MIAAVTTTRPTAMGLRVLRVVVRADAVRVMLPVKAAWCCQHVCGFRDADDMRRRLYGALSAPAITITVASPARARLLAVIGSRRLIPTLRLTAFASAWCPGAYWTTDSASCWSEE